MDSSMKIFTISTKESLRFYNAPATSSNSAYLARHFTRPVGGCPLKMPHPYLLARFACKKYYTGRLASKHQIGADVI